MFTVFENWSEDVLSHAVLVDGEHPGLQVTIAQFRELYDAHSFAAKKNNEALIQIHHEGKFLAQADAAEPGFNLTRWTDEILKDRGLTRKGAVWHMQGSLDFTYAAEPLEPKPAAS